MAIYSGFSHWKWWFSIAMLVYQRVISTCFRMDPLGDLQHHQCCFSHQTWNVAPAASEDVRDHEGERHQRNERGSASGDFLHHWGVKNGEHWCTWKLYSSHVCAIFIPSIYLSIYNIYIYIIMATAKWLILDFKCWYPYIYIFALLI